MIDRIPRLAAKRGKRRKPPRPTRETPRTQLLLPQTRLGWLKLAGVAAGSLMIVIVALLGLRFISDTGCSEFTTERTTVTLDRLKINVLPDALVGSFGVKLASVPLAEFSAESKRADVQAAASALPATLTPQSDLIVVHTCSVDPKLITVRMAVPPGVETLSHLDLYGWESKTRTWTWLGGEVDAAANEIVARINRMPSGLMLMKTSPPQPVLGVEMPFMMGGLAASTAALPQNVSEVNATGLYLGDLGGIVGADKALAGAAEWRAMQPNAIPAVRNWGSKGEVNRTVLRAMLSSEATRFVHVNNLVNWVDQGNFPGVEVDYRGLDVSQREAFAQFVELLGSRLAEKGKVLVVTVPAPLNLNFASGDASAVNGGIADFGYDLYRIGRAASQVKLDLCANPWALYSDQLGPLVEWVAGQVNPYKLQVIVPTLGVRQDANGRTVLVGLEQALADLGPLQAELPSALPGANVPLRWSGDVNMSDLRYDPVAKAHSYSYVDARGIQQTVWLGTAVSLKSALERLSQHNIRGITLRGIAQPGNDEGITQVVDGFMRGDLGSVHVPDPVVKVAFGSGTPFSLPMTASGESFIVQAPGGEGDYILQTVFHSLRPIALGDSHILVSKDADMAGGGATTTTASSVVTETTAISHTHTPELPAAVAPAVMLPGVNADTFELGGHVNNLMHATQMKSAGMTWARTEARGEDLPVAFIAEAKAKGLKVLVTAVGDRSRVMDEAYREEWARHLGKLAAAGADAIEVWSEPNYQAEWPTGQINGATYADLLKRAYFAIKQANLSALVISAGLAQTAGAYSGGCSSEGCDEIAFLNQMAAAGVKDYMDCVGVHYTSGYASPGTVGVNHYSQYYEPLRNAFYGAFNGAKPVCFTALGYVTAEGFPGGMPSNYSFAAGTTVANHAAWLAEAAKLSKDSGKVRLMIVWNVDSTRWIGDDAASGSLGTGPGGDPQAGYAMIRPDGTCPACESLRSVMR